MSTVKLKRSAVQGKIPTTSDLELGELAINTYDGKLYLKKDDGTASIVDVTSASGISDIVQDLTPQLGGNLDTNGNDILFGDNDKAIFGAGSDLLIYHTGSHSYIDDQGTGNLYLNSNGAGTIITGGGTQARFFNGAGVDLWYNNSQKFATTSTGVDVTGTVTATSGVIPTINGGTGASQTFTLQSTSGNANNSKILIGNIVSSDNGGISLFSAGASTSTLRMRVSGTTGDISFYEDTGTTPKFFWDASAESLGIGTSSPSATLDVVGAGGGNGEFALSRTAGATLFGQAQAALGRFGTSSNHNLQFITNNSGHMTITTAGRVGIGTTTPSTTLQVLSPAGTGYANTAAVVIGKAWDSGTVGDAQYGLIVDQRGARYDQQIGIKSSIYSAQGFYGGQTFEGFVKVRGVGVFGESPTSSEAYQKGIGVIGKATNATSNYNTTYGVIGLAEAGTTAYTASNAFEQGAFAGYFKAHGNARSVGVYADAYLDASPGAGQEAIPLVAATNGSELFRVQANGNVGIGTTAPDTKLHLSSNGSKFRITQDTSGGTFNGVEFEAYTGVINGGLIWNQATGEIRLDAQASYFPTIYSGGAERVRITTAGNVGIGTTNPVSTAGSDTFLQIYNSVDAGLSLKTANGDWDFKIDNPNGDFSLYQGGSRLFIVQKATGNVGIGTSSPSQKLDVQGTILVNNEIQFVDSNVRVYRSSNDLRLRTGGFDRVSILSTGNVGIGTTSPVRKLHVYGSGATVAAKVESTDTSQASIDLKNSQGEFRIINTNGGLQFYDQTDALYRLVIDTNGNVGIGTTNPGTPLDVDGTARATQFRLASTGVLEDATATTTATTQVAIDQWSATAYGGGKLIIEAKDGVNRHIVELLVTHDGTTAIATEYGATYTSSVLATYDVDISGGNVRILATPASTNSTAFKIMRTTMFS